jgi:dolichol-phosphate mannosyltransferase
MIWVLIPVYNEAEGIPKMLKETRNAIAAFGEFRLVLVDDGSTDETRIAIQRELQENDQLISLEHNSGPGAAFLAGFEFILQNATSRDSVLSLEGDGTADLSSLSAMFESLKNHDLVLASVYLNENGFSKTSFWRMGLSQLANGLSRWYLDLPQRTLTSFYRLWSLEILQKMQEKYPRLIDEPGFICQVELLYKARLLNAKIVEIPTRVYSDRRIGKSKMKLVKTAISHLKFLIGSNKYK